MMRVCVLGNSHVASLKQGWDELASAYSDVAISFFASRYKRLGALELRGGSLVPSNEKLAKDIAFTSSGLGRVILDDFDVFLVYALGLQLPRLGSRLSAAVRRQVIQDVLADSLNMRLCHLIREATSKPIYIGHNPQPALSPFSHTPPDAMAYPLVRELANRMLPIERGFLLEQPRETLFDDWYTRKQFSIGSTSLDVGDEVSNQPHRKADFAHMNAAFGKVWLESFLALAEREGFIES